MEEKRNDQLQVVWLAAGVLAFMAASLERTAVLYSVVKQWRAWVFIALNVVLLAILFTSKHAAFCTNRSESSAADNCHGENDRDSKAEKKRLRKQLECGMVAVADVDHDGVNHHHNLKKMKSGGVSEESEKIIECDDGGGGGKSILPKPPLSNEELNERVETFIATFRRQYLVSNVKGASRSGLYNSPASNNGGGILSESVTV